VASPPRLRFREACTAALHCTVHCTTRHVASAHSTASPKARPTHLFRAARRLSNRDTVEMSCRRGARRRSSFFFFELQQQQQQQHNNIHNNNTNTQACFVTSTRGRNRNHNSCPTHATRHTPHATRHTRAHYKPQLLHVEHPFRNLATRNPHDVGNAAKVVHVTFREERYGFTRAPGSARAPNAVDVVNARLE